MIFLCSIALATVQAEKLTAPYRDLFGHGMSDRNVDTFWCSHLVDEQPLNGAPSTLGAVSPEAVHCLADFFHRMDRPIVPRLIKSMERLTHLSPKDDLAAGITAWTMQWTAGDFRSPVNVAKWHVLAEWYLQKASKEGDQVQRSFAALAFADCALNSLSDLSRPEKLAALDARSQRIRTYRSRLTDVYHTFRHSVPERALMALHELFVSDIQLSDWKDMSRIAETARTDFPSLSKWGCYSIAEFGRTRRRPR
ncbi:hypothetical protein [Fimbriimonas ginsengisoli]|uniref:hypothetical protein n=1 Tax=Fimbriimonas ginsengisoli TaxID=1005039 RepID=UPI00046D101B|nr:hypothetical protein [Fimbriimonas ginsengisoli]